MDVDPGDLGVSLKMSRKRPAVPCSARRSNGLPCANFAMHGGRVCHAHGGRAPQVKAAAVRRLTEADVRRLFAEWQAREEARRAALAPWLRAIRAEWMVSPLDPANSGKRLRMIAREMSATAAALRVEAWRLLREAGDLGTDAGAVRLPRTS